MRSSVWILVLATSLAAGCAAPVNVEQERNALLTADRAWSQATTDVEKWLSYFANDASAYPQGMPIVSGTSALRELLTKLTTMPGFSIRWSATKADVGKSGDLGYTAGTYELTVNDATGTPTTEKGKYVTVWKKQADGQWKVVEDIFNADAPTPAAPTAPSQK